MSFNRMGSNKLPTTQNALKLIGVKLLYNIMTRVILLKLVLLYVRPHPQKYFFSTRPTQKMLFSTLYFVVN